MFIELVIVSSTYCLFAALINNQMEENMIREHNIEIQMEKALENEEFMCFPIDGGGVSMYYNYIEYNRTVRDGDDLLVYVNFLVDGCSSNNCGIYADRNFTKFITDDVDYDDGSELFDLYRDEAGLYKLTFKKDTNDNYYWYSSEIVK